MGQQTYSTNTTTTTTTTNNNNDKLNNNNNNDNKHNTNDNNNNNDNVFPRFPSIPHKQAAKHARRPAPGGVIRATETMCSSALGPSIRAHACYASSMLLEDNLPVDSL